MKGKEMLRKLEDLYLRLDGVEYLLRAMSCDGNHETSANALLMLSDEILSVKDELDSLITEKPLSE